jgi:hypothetical protein
MVVTMVVAARATSAEFPVTAAVALAGFAQFFFVHAGSAQFPTVTAAARHYAESARAKLKGLRLHREPSHQ